MREKSLMSTQSNQPKAFLSSLQTREQMVSKKELQPKLFNARAAAEVVLSRESGRVVADAAPMAIQALCAREGINVLFSHHPMTNGKTIYLGPLAFTNPMLSIYVYGHALHERNHICYTDFDIVRSLDAPIRGLTNVFEDVRVDEIGQRDFAGYILWREALLFALSEEGELFFVKVNSSRRIQDVLCGFLHALLSVTRLHFESCEKYRSQLRRQLVTLIGEALVGKIESIALSAFPLEDTGAARDLSERIMKLLIDANEALNEAEDEKRVSTKRPLDQTSLSLFEEEGDFDEGLFKATLLETTSASQRAQIAKIALNHQIDWTDIDIEAGVNWFVQYMPKERSIVMEGNVRGKWLDLPGHLTANQEDAQSRFYEALPGLAAFKNAFENLMRRPLLAPLGAKSSGWDVDDQVLDRIKVGDDRIFSSDLRMDGHDVAVQILLDNSGSLNREEMCLVKVIGTIVESQLKRLNGIKAATAVFPGEGSMGVYRVSDFHSSPMEVTRRLSPLTAYGPTPIILSVFWAAEVLEQRQESKKLVFIVTDGAFNEENLRYSIHALKSKGIDVAVVSVGYLTSRFGHFYANASEAKDIPNAILSIFKDLKNAAYFEGSRA